MGSTPPQRSISRGSRRKAKLTSKSLTEYVAYFSRDLATATRTRPNKQLAVSVIMRRPVPLRFQVLMVLLRYGSLCEFDQVRMTITEIARLTNCPYSTVHTVIERFLRRGCRILPSQRKGHSGRPPRVIVGPLRDFLLDRVTLQMWAGLALHKRCELIQQQFGVRVGITTLFQFY